MVSVIQRYDKWLEYALLYEQFQYKQTLRAYIDFCESTGSNTILFKGFCDWFSRYGDTDPVSYCHICDTDTLVEIVKNHRNGFRIFILYEVLHNTPVFEAYKILGKMVGYHNIDFIDYEYCYMKLYKDNTNFDDSDKIINPKKLTDLPLEVINLILNEVDTIGQISLRKVSRSIRYFVDKELSKKKKLFVHFRPRFCAIKYYKEDMIFESVGSNNCVLYVDGKTFKISQTPTEAVMNSFESILNIPDIKVDRLIVTNREAGFISENDTLNTDYDQMLCTRLEKIFQSRSSKLEVKLLTLTMFSMSLNVKTIIPYLEPKSVPQIEVVHLNDFSETMTIDGVPVDCIMEEIVKSDLWKNIPERILLIPKWSGEKIPAGLIRHFTDFMTDGEKHRSFGKKTILFAKQQTEFQNLKRIILSFDRNCGHIYHEEYEKIKNETRLISTEHEDEHGKILRLTYPDAHKSIDICFQ